MAAVSLLFIVPLLIGMWELGRLVFVQELVANAAREWARLAGQAYTNDSSGNATQVTKSSGTINVENQVYQYLYAGGLWELSKSDVTTTFAFTAPNSAGVTPTEPYLGEKNQPFTVSVSVPWSKVRWINLGLINPTTVQYTARWQMLVDDPFTVNETVPVW
jgi:hypothetical protein